MKKNAGRTGMTIRDFIGGLVLAVLLSGAALGAEPSYSAAEAQDGKAAYAQNCTSCHGAHLTDGHFAPALKGKMFDNQWGGRSVADLFTYVKTNMPPGRAGSLEPKTYRALVSFLLSENGAAAGAAPLPSDVNLMSQLMIPGKPVSEQAKLHDSPVGQLTPGAKLPAWPALDNPLDHWTSVTDAMLDAPAPGDWLTWRRAHDALGFSPLSEINKNNAKDLRLAWALTIPPGTNEIEPLMHDGVLFVWSFKDNVQAINATTGDELWHYQRQLPDNTAYSTKRNMALYGDKLFVGTSDLHEVALDVHTGHVVWDHPIADANGLTLNGGPLVARGKVMQGMTGGKDGGSFIVAMDAGTGEEAWRFYSVAREGDAANSWNGLPIDKRHGGSVWTAGSYDAEHNLALFGPAPSYDTGPLLDRSDKPGVTNDALYTDTTIALNPDTGKLVWYYQHVKNDQWDLDWAFERQIVRLPVNGENKKLVLTAGKEAVWDAVDAATGKYAFSFDMGIQNVIKAIDPATGEKTINPDVIPSHDHPVTICPHGGGGRDWIPTSFNPVTKVLYVPAEESCMVFTPVAKGEHGFLSSGVNETLSPRADSDGKYGRLEAIDMTTRKPLWIDRQRAVQSSGVLDTAGGIVFASAIDRWFTAYDDSNGKVLWRARLSDIANAPPISYSVNGKQYVAIVAGYGGSSASTFTVLTPEIPLPVTNGAQVWVFALPGEGAQKAERKWWPF